VTGTGTGTGDARFRDTARRIEGDHPGWMVVFGTYTRQYVAFPLFHVPPGTVLADADPDTLTRQIRATERRHRKPGDTPGSPPASRPQRPAAP
jgi:hypothetical protein